MYKAREQKDILQEMINSSKAKTGLFEGTFQYDALASNSIEFAKVEVELEELNKVAFADTSHGEYLTMIAKQYGVIRKEATKAIGVLTVKGTGTIYAGATFATESGIQFVAIENTEIKENGQINIEAVTAGVIGNVDAETINVISMSIPGINSVINSEPTMGGYDEETDAELLDRYLFKVRNPATSGNKNNYELWAREIEGVGGARCIPLWNGNGTVKVVIIDANLNVADETLLNKVRAYLEEEKPIGADLTVVSATAVNVKVAANIYGSVNEDEFKEKVDTYFKEIGFNRGYVSVAHIGKTLLECSGVIDYDSLTLNGEAKNIPLTEEQLPILENEVDFNVVST